MSACGGPDASPPPPPARPGASRMARRPEVLCGALVVLGCACLVALKVSCSCAKDMTMPAKLPVSFFSSTSPVHDLFLGQLDQAEDIRQSSEVTLFFFYAPWCGQSVAVREEIEQVANSLADQVSFVAINCWWNQGKCRKQKHFFYFPVIYLYHLSFGPIEYKGPMNAVYLEKFVRRVMTPLLYISSQSKLQQFLSNYEPSVLGYFAFSASPQPPGYLTFFTSALHSLNRDYLGTIHFGVITDELLAKEIPLTISGSIYLHRNVNASLLYPHETMNFTAENIWKWALENQETFLCWLQPHRGKSLLLHRELKKGPALFLFLPFDPLAKHHPLLDEVSKLALDYNSCPRSDIEALGGGDPRPPPAGSASGPSPSCCHTVLLPAPWHGFSRTRDVCDVCVSRTGGLRPRPLVRLRCSFLAARAAVDAFLLQEQAAFHLWPETGPSCSNFPRFYSPFSHYTACCRTVKGQQLSAAASEKTPLRPLGEAALAPPWRPGGEEPHRAAAPVAEKAGLLARGALGGSALTGLSCRTNRSLNLYLLDSNLFWTYAERLGAPSSAPVKEFAAIVDLKEEVHYVLGQKQALLRATLETFIHNYSVQYSPLRRHLVGDTRSRPSPVQNSLQEVTTSSFQELVLSSPKAVLLLYYAPWCGFCASLSHVFIRLARILPPEHFIVARIDISQNDLPWEFMSDHLPNILFFPHDRKDQSTQFPAASQINLPNLLKFVLSHSSQPSLAAGLEPSVKGCSLGEAALQQGRIAHLEREIETLRAKIRVLHRAQGQLQGQLSEARRQSQQLQQEALRKQQRHQERLQGLCSQKAWQLQDMAEKLRELADASETLLTENTFLKVLLASAERRRVAEPTSEHSLPEEEEEASLPVQGQERFSKAGEAAAPLDSRAVPEHSKENWTEELS